MIALREFVLVSVVGKRSPHTMQVRGSKPAVDIEKNSREMLLWDFKVRGTLFCSAPAAQCSTRKPFFFFRSCEWNSEILGIDKKNIQK